MSPRPPPRLLGMGAVTCQIAMSLDGYVAGPDQGPEDPLGVGGMRLHDWLFADPPHPADRGLIDTLLDGNGAYVMGRRMFGGGPGPWDPAWRGWWGEDPPWHAPVFVLTHVPRAPLVMAGGTTFTFVTDGFDAALALARTAAAGQDVCVAGGAATVRQALRRGVLDELHLHLVPITLGAGERLLEDVGELRLRPLEVVASPAVTHLRYAVDR